MFYVFQPIVESDNGPVGEGIGDGVPAIKLVDAISLPPIHFSS